MRQNKTEKEGRKEGRQEICNSEKIEAKSKKKLKIEAERKIKLLENWENSYSGERKENEEQIKRFASRRGLEYPVCIPYGH